jgi:hypothetical protein
MLSSQFHCAKTGRKKMQKHAYFLKREDEGCGGENQTLSSAFA